MIERQPLRLRDLFYVARSLLLVGRVDQRLVVDARLLFSKARATALNDIPRKGLRVRSRRFSRQSPITPSRHEPWSVRLNRPCRIAYRKATKPIRG